MQTKTKSRGRLLKLPEVAERLGIHQGSVRRLIREKKLGVVRLGRKSVRVAESDLDSFVEERRRAAGA